MNYPIRHTVLEEQDGLTYLAALESFGHVVEGPDHPELGKFVTGIDGLAAPDGFAWSFKLNGEFIPLGVSSQLVVEGQRLDCEIIAYGEFPQVG